MKLNHIIIIIGILSFSIQTVIAVERTATHKIKQSLTRKKLISRVQNDNNRLSDQNSSVKRNLNTRHHDDINNFTTGRIKIDIANKDLRAKIISKDSNLNLPEIKKESLATEINIEHTREELEYANNKAKL